MDRVELTLRAQDRHFWYQGLHAHLTATLDALAVPDGALVLECGCGTGAQMGVLGRYGRVFGFDLLPNGLMHARGVCPRLARADATRIPFRDDTFDLVASFDLVQFVPDDTAVLAEMVRVLKPGGRLVASVVALEALRGDHAEMWGELRRYSRADVRRLAEDAGLEVARLTFLFAALAPILLVLRGYQRWRRRRGAPRSQADIQMPPASINAVMAWLLRREAAVARRWDLPFGSTLLLAGRKPPKRTPR